MAANNRTYAMMVADRMNLRGCQAQLMRNIRFNAADYKSRHGATTGAIQSSQLTIDNYKTYAEEEGKRIAEIDCSICCENIVPILSNGMKIYRLPQCQHLVCSQCLVCMMISSENGDEFKILLMNRHGEAEEMPESITRNSQFTYARCPQCRQPVLMANGDIHEAELEARNYRMKQVIELYEDGDHAWKVERDTLREANNELKEANDKLRKDLADMTRNRDMLAQPLRREIQKLTIALGKERVGKATVMKANFHLQRQLQDVRSILEKHCDQVQLHVTDLGAVLSRKRLHSASADSVVAINDDDDGVSPVKRELSDRSSSSDDDLPPAFPWEDTPAAEGSASGGRRFYQNGRRVLVPRRMHGVSSSSSAAAAPSSSSQLSNDESNNLEEDNE